MHLVDCLPRSVKRRSSRIECLLEIVQALLRLTIQVPLFSTHHHNLDSPSTGMVVRVIHCAGSCDPLFGVRPGPSLFHGGHAESLTDRNYCGCLSSVL